MSVTTFQSFCCVNYHFLMLLLCHLPFSNAFVVSVTIFQCFCCQLPFSNAFVVSVTIFQCFCCVSYHFPMLLLCQLPFSNAFVVNYHFPMLLLCQLPFPNAFVVSVTIFQYFCCVVEERRDYEFGWILKLPPFYKE